MVTDFHGLGKIILTRFRDVSFLLYAFPGGHVTWTWSCDQLVILSNWIVILTDIVGKCLVVWANLHMTNLS